MAARRRRAASTTGAGRTRSYGGLTTKQRNALPRSAFLDPKRRRFPAPTKAQAKAAGIPEGQRVNTLRNALSRAAQAQARGVKRVTPAMAQRAVAKRGRGQVASVAAKKTKRGTPRRRRR